MGEAPCRRGSSNLTDVRSTEWQACGQGRQEGAACILRETENSAHGQCY